ncbi:unnamed protein product [Allacma fusca]|uniref:Uncharacterized protein n=1 Tax=Allacma fusca TaxID=39272 RepID=A0A8J2JCN1_9HEXA|nr:unnamed protein product [Allacma fusca]
MIDFEGFDVKLAYKVLAHPESNHAAQIFIQLARPVLGELMERLVVLGSNKYKWKAELRRHLPEETTPTWYGGPKDFKPLAVYGA